MPSPRSSSASQSPPYTYRPLPTLRQRTRPVPFTIVTTLPLIVHTVLGAAVIVGVVLAFVVVATAKVTSTYRSLARP